MTTQKKVKNSILKVEKNDISNMDIEAFVYYASDNLKLGSGTGNAISMRGGPSIQEELDKIGSKNVGDVVITKAGNLKSKFIIHAVGPKFQEENINEKLQNLILNTLKEAEQKGIKKIAFPAMGAGFYGIPINTSALITIGTINKYLENGAKFEEVVVCLNDNREYKPFKAKLENSNK